MNDLGLTHIALQVKNMDRSLAFYERFAEMRPVHSRTDSESGRRVVWISDRTRPFVVVLLELLEDESIDTVLRPFAHLGVGVGSREAVDRLCEMARAENILIDGPTDSGYPIGYWAFISDPDGHTLEIAFGQEVALTVDNSD